jgi:hypothetical protein
MAWSDYVLILENPNYTLYIIFSNAVKKYEVFLYTDGTHRSHSLALVEMFGLAVL